MLLKYTMSQQVAPFSYCNTKLLCWQERCRLPGPWKKTLSTYQVRRLLDTIHPLTQGFNRSVLNPLSSSLVLHVMSDNAFDSSQTEPLLYGSSPQIDPYVYGPLSNKIIIIIKFLLCWNQEVHLYLSIYLSSCLSVCLSSCLSIYPSIYLWLYSPLLGLGRFFSFLIFYTVGRTPWTGDQPVARPLPAHRRAQTQNKRTQTSMPQVGLETTIPVFKWGKTVYALDRAASVIGWRFISDTIKASWSYPELVKFK
jgi:hypothetical protein